jgi:hypothetical protein
MAQITDERAKAFAKALVACGGNKTQAAITIGYDIGPRSRVAGSDLARNPKVLKYLQPMVLEALQALTPRAVVTLGALLNNKSGYIRLEAVKDILNRNGVGVGKEPVQTGQLVVNINIRDHDKLGGGVETSSLPQPQVVDVEPTLPDEDAEVAAAQPLLTLDGIPLVVPHEQPGGLKSDTQKPRASPTHDFSPEVTSAEEVLGVGRISAEEVSRVLEEEGEGVGQGGKVVVGKLVL